MLNLNRNKYRWAKPRDNRTFLTKVADLNEFLSNQIRKYGWIILLLGVLGVVGTMDYEDQVCKNPQSTQCLEYKDQKQQKQQKQ